MTRSRSVWLVLAAWFVGNVAAAEESASYQFTRVEVALEGAAEESVVTGTNDFGSLCGYYDDGKTRHGFVIRRGNLARIDVPLPGVEGTFPAAINLRGDVAGTFWQGNGVHGFVFEGGRYRTFDLPIKGVLELTVAGMNARGTIVGSYEDMDGAHHGFLLEGPAFRRIEVDLPGASDTKARGINDEGTVIGDFRDAQGQHGFVLASGRYRKVDALSPEQGTQLVAINDRGQMLVYAGQAAYVSTRGRLREIPCFPSALVGGPSDNKCVPVTLPTGIDGRGRIVGHAEYPVRAGGPLAGLTFGFVATPD